MAEPITVYRNGKYFEELGRDNKEEILFKGHHVTHLPWMRYHEWNYIPLLPGNRFIPYQNVGVAVKKLCHITHNEEFKEISQNDKYYVFKPKQKFGKSGYISHSKQVGKSYALCEPSALPPNHQTQYRMVNMHKEVLPGYYIWWSIDHSCVPTVPSWKLEKYFGHQWYGYYTSEPFERPITSRYGNHMFTSYIMQLLQSYQSAYGSPLPRIEFRCGGTLRYRCEICYVVIVCAVNPHEKHSLSEEEFPIIWENVQIIYNSNGQVSFVQPPEITLRNGITGYYEDGMFSDYIPYSWDTYAFALHFPTEHFKLEIPKLTLFSTKTIEHDDFCTKKRPDPLNNHKPSCPNKHLITHFL